MTRRIVLHGLRYAAHRQGPLSCTAPFTSIFRLKHRSVITQHTSRRYDSTSAAVTDEIDGLSDGKTWGNLVRKTTALPNVKYNAFNRPGLDDNPDARRDQEHTVESASRHETSVLRESLRRQRREALRNVQGTDVEVKQALYEMLRRSAGLGRTDEVAMIVEELVAERQEPPNLRIYAAMIISNVNSEYGSAADVERILAEMDAEGLTPDASCYHNALRVLAVHPDCFLRDRIVTEMRERWMTINVHGRIDVIAGLLREGLAEQALDNYTSDDEVRNLAPIWLKDMFIFHLCDLDEMEYALRMMQDRVQSGEANISTSVWYYLFDHACSHLHVGILSLSTKAITNPHLSTTH